MQITPYYENSQALLDNIHLCELFLQLMKEEDSENTRSEIARLYEEIDRREAQCEKTAMCPMPFLRFALGLDGVAWFCFVFAACCALDGALSNAVLALSGSPVPTFDFAFSLYSIYHEDFLFPDALSFVDPDNSPLRFVLKLEQKEPLARALHLPMQLRQNILYFVTTGSIGNRLGYALWYPKEPFLSLHQPVYDDFLRLLQNAPDGQRPLLFLAGPAGSGKQTLLKRLAAKISSPLVCSDLGAAAQLDHDPFSSFCIELAADTVLCGGILCLSRYMQESMPILQKILHFLPDGVTVAVLSDSEDCQAPVLHRREVLVRRIGALDEKDYESVTHALKKRYSTAPEQPFAYYQLTVGQLEQVWLDAFIQAGAQTETAACPRDIAKAVRALGGGVAKAQTIEATASLCDIVAVPETMTRLRTVCSLVRGWRRTWALYNTSGAIPYKSGVTALFFGPSGTGKTMAACAIANELGLELWRIDLSAVLDKYIGETEKHLAEVFATAKERNCILFFDEADALFSKRTEISSSHDRYANVETAFLLQCMEAYDGVILLATNLYQNFDEAFLRRISVVVRFSMPDGALRKELWQKAFSPAVRLQEGLDLSLLASELELSPAEICSAAQKAVALALELGDGMVTQSCLREALETELEKRGQISALRMLQTIFEE